MEKNINSQLSEIVGKEDIATDAFERTFYSHDTLPTPRLISSLFKTIPDAIVRPESTEEVAQIMRLASDQGIPVIPRAAASSALGGVIPVKGGIVLDLVKLNKIGELSVDELWVEVETGVIFKDLMDFLSLKGLAVFSYPSSAPSATVGGWISTGGYGIGSLKYGPIWEQVKELEIVTPIGDILHVSKESTYPKIEWFFGTEGQMGIITKVKLEIRKNPENLSVRGVYVTGNRQLVELVREIREFPYRLEFFDSDLMSLKNMLSEKKAEDKDLILVAVEGSEEEINSDLDTFDNIIKQKGLHVAEQDLSDHEWEERYYPMKIGRLGPTLLAGEFVIPIDQLESALDKIKSLQKKYNSKIGIDVQVISQESVLLLAMYLADERRTIRYITHLALARDIINIGLSHGGKPYGTGLWGAVYIKKRFANEYLQELKGVKKKLDPRGIMNPGKFFKAEARFRIPINRLSWSILMNILGFVSRFT